MNFTIRAFVGDSRISTAVSYNKDNKNHMVQTFPEKKKFPSLRNWMMFYTKKNEATSFKMEPSAAAKPVLPDTPTQALVRKYYNAFGFQNTITPRSHYITQSVLYVFTNNNFLPVFFNRQTGMVRIGAQDSINELTDIHTCKFFVKRGYYDFNPVTLPVISEPNLGQPVVAFSHSTYTNAFMTNTSNLDGMKKVFTAAGYYVKDFYRNNYKTENDMLNAIWSTSGIRALAQPTWWYTSQELVIWTSRTTNSRAKLSEWLAANPSTSYPSLPPSPSTPVV